MTMEIRDKRGVGPEGDHISLHLEHLDADLSTSDCRALLNGSHLRRRGRDYEPIPVLPTVHYTRTPTDHMTQVLCPTKNDPMR